MRNPKKCKTEDTTHITPRNQDETRYSAGIITKGLQKIFTHTRESQLGAIGMNVKTQEQRKTLEEVIDYAIESYPGNENKSTRLYIIQKAVESQANVQEECIHSQTNTTSRNIHIIKRVFSFFSNISKDFKLSLLSILLLGILINLWTTRYVYHKEGRSNYRTNRWTSKVELLNSSEGKWETIKSTQDTTPHQETIITLDHSPFDEEPNNVQTIQDSGTKKTLYQWTDKSGRIQISDQDPRSVKSSH